MKTSKILKKNVTKYRDNYVMNYYVIGKREWKEKQFFKKSCEINNLCIFYVHYSVTKIKWWEKIILKNIYYMQREKNYE
jgi:hypothetical protein